MRSRAGCQILSQADFPNALNMTGGIVRWQGGRAAGSENQGMAFFLTGNYSSGVEMAYAMEKGLQKFYTLLAEKAESEENRELLEMMARLEDGHMAKLSSQYSDVVLDGDTIREDITEGGFDAKQFSDEFAETLKDIESILHTGMMFEAQAFDMYSRLSRNAHDEQRRDFYLQMAKEEQHHLKRLASELDKRLA